MNYSENDVCILHLSDLHIVNESSSKTTKNVVLPLVFDKLLKDIEIISENMDELIIVVSGDITFQAKYEMNEQAIIYFFNRLHDCLNKKIKGIIFVPGNHDVKRKGYKTNLSIMSDENSEFNVLSGYQEYMRIINKIRREYGLAEENSSFGVEKIECGNYKCCFIKTDTAWCTTNDENCKQGDIVLGEYQKKSLLNQYRTVNPNSNVDITLLVSHYPLAWLSVSERESLISLMMNESKLNTDVILCGHIHNVDALNYSTHEHSIMTLITGIGWPNDITDDDYKNNQERRYSVYKINPARNTCDIIMRKSDRSGSFDYDYSVYTEEREKDCHKIVYPLRAAHKSLAFIKMNSPKKIDEQSIHISPIVADHIKFVSNNLAKFSGHLTALIARYKNDFYEKFDYWLCLKNISDVEKIRNSEQFLNDLAFEEVCDYILDEVYFYLYDNADTIQNENVMSMWIDFCIKEDEGNFNSFLDEICQLVIDDFSECFPNDALIRTHFRKHQGKINHDVYTAVCAQISGTEGSNSLPKDLPWGGFVKAAYENETSLVYSANKKLNSISTDWQEFITIIPQFEDSIWEIRDSRRKLVRRPKLTFGISIKGTNKLIDAVMTMSIMDFLMLEKHISSQLDEYVRLFGLPMKKP